jgi:AcrR family transcriptional regulator
MQYLKEDIRQKIIRSALREFSENGYQNASMRSIAARADIVSGNIYRYFKNKADLFDSAVGPAYALVQGMIKQYIETIENQSGEFELCERFADIKIETKKCLGRLLQSTYEILILLDKSEGTKYGACRDEIKQAIADTLRGTFKNELRNRGIEVKNDLIYDVVASAFIDGVCLILERSANEDMADLISRWQDIVFMGLHNRIS